MWPLLGARYDENANKIRESDRILTPGFLRRLIKNSFKLEELRSSNWTRIRDFEELGEDDDEIKVFQRFDFIH